MKKSKGMEIFGKDVCFDRVLKKYMKIKDYKKYIKFKESGKPLDLMTAEKVAKAMLVWAVDNGVSYFTHWFSPLSGSMAEKRIAFVERVARDKVKDDFSENELVKGEVDASSFPSGGSRSTFEARGVTIWDYESPAFIKSDLCGNKTLCIPAMFCSNNGVVLDEKTPLCRAVESVSGEALRILKILGYKKAKRVLCNVGAEQEYFLIKKDLVEKRLDLKFLGKTILGDRPSKKQENNTHYLGGTSDEIAGFMKEVDNQLWSLGVVVKVQHNEVSPNQFELVPIFTEANIACDQNQLVMEVIKKTAKRHGFEAIFNEFPFFGVNGSGKHVNLSLSTDNGINLFDSKKADKNLFKLFFSGMIAAVNNFHELISASVFTWENEFRLGSGEAPPKIFSMYIGDVVELLFKDLKSGLNIHNKASNDSLDRNRTTPFAYNGNKFEFRMVGASQNISWPCVCVMTAYAAELKKIADILEQSKDINKAVVELTLENYEKSKSIIFNGNGYDKMWHTEAEKRGLKNKKEGVGQYSIYTESKVVNLFESLGILSREELTIRQKVSEKKYFESVLLEAKIMQRMLRENIIVGLLDFLLELKRSNLSVNKIIAQKISEAINELHSKSELLEVLILQAEEKDNTQEMAKKMKEIRAIYDKIELLIPSKLKPIPTYDELLFQ